MKKKVAAGVFTGLLICSLGYVIWIEWFTHSRVEGITFGLSKGCYRKSELVEIWIKNERTTSITVYAPSSIDKLAVKGWKTAFAWRFIPEAWPSVMVSPGEKAAFMRWNSTERGIFRVKVPHVAPPIGKEVTLFFSVI
ncbi:MAG: hypothetical protein GWO20_09425 [Candidatus Korarchaeota archaeon]|nr:hypothetical protein [Candidatus Korarchaeota archaeon]NIU83668.1 hypothetical protein [Candidatus Thorarchaeota archaeon]NIW13886.1 hypothetical protein [Candidatus Thorarchaeota archaeon]NIW51992.1 hypothetical protein [Candidatus Korarchaeota archaeon]